MRAISVDLPALGNPTRPTSASSFSSRRRSLLLARLARLHLSRRAVGRGGEVRVAHAAAAALGDEHALALVGEVGEQRVAARPAVGRLFS